MAQIIDGCNDKRCPKQLQCYRRTQNVKKQYFRYWIGCKHFWDISQAPKKQVLI